RRTLHDRGPRLLLAAGAQETFPFHILNPRRSPRVVRIIGARDWPRLLEKLETFRRAPRRAFYLRKIGQARPESSVLDCTSDRDGLVEQRLGLAGFPGVAANDGEV